MPSRLRAPALPAVSMGDPARLGLEGILKAAAAMASRRGAPALVVVGDAGAMRIAARRLRGVPEPRPGRAGDALVTAPINKEWLNGAGHRFPGHSELLAELSRARLWRMMFAGDQLRLALVTVHLGVRRGLRGAQRPG